MSADWPEVSIEELKASSKNAIAMGPFGSRIKAENFVEDGIPIIKGGNLTGDFIVEDKFDFLTEEKADELKTSNAFRSDIVITHRGTIGQVGIIPDNSKFERYVVSQSQLKVTLDQEKVNPYFVYHRFSSAVYVPPKNPPFSHQNPYTNNVFLENIALKYVPFMEH